jgi:hypothetical protein
MYTRTGQEEWNNEELIIAVCRTRRPSCYVQALILLAYYVLLLTTFLISSL